jgi:quercetin dioxygenase-like cupin family protein
MSFQAGDSFYLASNVPHGVETLSATRVLDTFSPPRTDYLAIDEKVLPRRFVASSGQ